MFPPRWFLPYDAIFQLITAFVALAVAMYALRGHQWVRERTLFALFLAFLLLSIGLFINGITLSYASLNGISFSHSGTSSAIADFGFWAYYVMSLIAFSILVLAYTHRLRESSLALAAGGMMGRGGAGTALVLIGPLLELFLVILLFVIIVAQLAHNVVKHNRYSALVTFSFVLLLLSHLLIMFSSLEDIIYVIGRLLELSGFLALLAVLVGLRRTG
jgi:hypothetical protein